VKVIYITGVSGFLGSHLARALLRQGWEVHGLKRSTSDLTRLRDVAGRIIFHDVDVEPLEQLFAVGPPPDAIAHLATLYGYKGEPASTIAQANTFFPLRLLEAAAGCGVKLFVNADTCFTVEYKHLQAYSLSKRQFVEWGKILAGPGLRFVNLKLQHPYGPGDGASKFVPFIIRSCLESSGDIPLTAGEQKKDFLYVDDVLTAFRAVLEGQDRLPQGFVSLDCGSGRAVPIREIVQTVHRVTGSRATPRFGALPYRENEIMFSQADVSGLRALGWQPVVSLEQGIRKILREDFGRG
jgi:nucleoside-diphosphate-sugar epimerase